MAEVLPGGKEEDADWRPRFGSSFVSLLTRTMLANSLEFMLRLSAPLPWMATIACLPKNSHSVSLLYTVTIYLLTLPMKNLSLLVFVILLGVLTSAIAQTTKSLPKQSQGVQKNAALGATSFMGIALDQPFPGDMQPCPKHKQFPSMIDHDATKELGVPCHHQKAPDQFEVWNGPDLGVGHILEVLTFQGMPLSFRLVIGRIKFNDVAEIFKAKYGPALRSNAEPVWTRDGKEFLARELQWEGTRLRIKLSEIGKDVNWGEAVIQNVELVNTRDAKKREAASEAASKL